MIVSLLEVSLEFVYLAKQGVFDSGRLRADMKMGRQLLG